MIKGKHVGLRAIEEADLPQLLEWRNRPEFRMYFREHRELSMIQQRDWFQGINRKDSNAKMFSIVRLADGALMGACGLCYLDPYNRSADFSIYLGIDDLYIDDVYAPDVAATLLRYGFEELALHRVWAEIYDIDEKKKKFFEKLEFHLDGRHRETHWTQGKWCDSLFFGLLDREFKELV
jgi:RimJ/RimL family protein N-acetyltransferase